MPRADSRRSILQRQHRRHIGACVDMVLNRLIVWAAPLMTFGAFVYTLAILTAGAGLPIAA